MGVVKIGLNALDLSFRHTKSIGIFNVAIGLCRGLANHTAVELTIVCDMDFQAELMSSEDLDWTRVQFDICLLYTSPSPRDA